MCDSKIIDMENIISNDKNDNKLKMFVKDLINNVKQNYNTKDIDNEIKNLRKKYHILPSKRELSNIYEKYFNKISIHNNLQYYLIKKSARSRSGVLVCTIVLSPGKFSCPKNCSYCPTETDLNGNHTQPKSYLSTEPAMLRALNHNFDIKGQLHDRINTYISQGNIKNSAKLEVILSGGTWESYPIEYRNTVINEIYWAANIFNNKRDCLSLEEEITINETSNFRVIGLTIETRPDFITKTSIKDYRKWGVTRVQIGVQHYNNVILEKINRDCTTDDTIKAIKLLKSCGFKVVCHLMPDLPFSSPYHDYEMFKMAIYHRDLQFDDVKIYPTAICKSSDPNLIVTSDIINWYNEGKYKPYAENNLDSLIDVIVYYKQNVKPWIRIERIVRDIPKQSILAGYESISNLRQVIQDKMKKDNIKCHCVRCMEIGDEYENYKPLLVVQKYIASEGIEYWISIEKHNKYLISFWLSYLLFIIKYYINLLFFKNEIFWSGNLKSYSGLIGFCRFRIDNNPGGGFIKELDHCALIREVHVYGHSLGIGDNGNSTQHKGYGQLLVKTAENIAKQYGYDKIAVIAGVGTREYYKNKCGYFLNGTYMIKHI